MIITRGKRKGLHAIPVQFANDWISADLDDRSNIILNPLSVQLEPEDLAWFWERLPFDSSMFTFLYQIHGNRFRRRNLRRRDA